MTVEDWLKNSPDVSVMEEHSDPRISSKPEADDPVYVVGTSALNPHNRTIKNAIPARFATKPEQTGTKTEVDSLIWFEEEFRDRAQLIRFNALIFRMPGGNYTPDITAFLDGGHIACEVKPAGWDGFQQNANASKKSILEAQHHWGYMFRMFWVVKSRAADIKAGAPMFSMVALDGGKI